SRFLSLAVEEEVADGGRYFHWCRNAAHVCSPILTQFSPPTPWCLVELVLEVLVEGFAFTGPDWNDWVDDDGDGDEEFGSWSAVVKEEEAEAEVDVGAGDWTVVSLAVCCCCVVGAKGGREEDTPGPWESGG